jgi:alanyl-tRNA synthetase
VKRLYWTNPDICEVEVEVKALADNRVTIEPILFHPDEGGQSADKGTIGGALVLSVEITDGQIIHTLDKPLQDGKYVAQVDALQRLHTASQHTAQHIISGIADKQFNLKTVGVHIGFERSTVDFDRKIDWQTAQAIEQQSMEVIAGNIPVETVFDETDVRSRFDLTEIDSDLIRVVKIGDCDASACCGTHVQRTGDIGILRILDLENKKEGVRLFFAAGKKAIEFSQAETSVLRELRKLSKCSTPDLPVIIAKSLDQAKRLNKEVYRLQALMLPSLVESAQAIDTGSSKIGIWTGDVSAKLTSKLAALIAERIEGAGIVVSDNNLAINSKTLNAKALFDKLQKAFGAKGGGSPNAASGRLESTVTIEQIIKILDQK